MNVAVLKYSTLDHFEPVTISIIVFHNLLMPLNSIDNYISCNCALSKFIGKNILEWSMNYEIASISGKRIKVQIMYHVGLEKSHIHLKFGTVPTGNRTNLMQTLRRIKGNSEFI